MDENMKTKIEKWIQEDGRRAERRVVETKFDKQGEAERTIELHMEDPRPLKLQQRITEKIRPAIVERKTETINPLTGEVIERKVELIEPKSNMQIVDHIGVLDPSKKAEPTQETNLDPVNPNFNQPPVGNPVYLQEKDLKALLETLKNTQVQTEGSGSSEFETKLKSLGMADAAARKSSKASLTNDKMLMVVIVAQVIALGYVLFFM